MRVGQHRFRRQIPDHGDFDPRFLQHRGATALYEMIGLMDGEHDPRHLMSRNQCAA